MTERERERISREGRVSAAFDTHVLQAGGPRDHSPSRSPGTLALNRSVQKGWDSGKNHKAGAKQPRTSPGVGERMPLFIQINRNRTGAVAAN